MASLLKIERLMDLEALSLLATFKEAGFKEFNLSVSEAYQIIKAAEKRLGRELSHEEVTSGALKDILTVEDYKAVIKIPEMKQEHADEVMRALSMEHHAQDHPNVDRGSPSTSIFDATDSELEKLMPETGKEFGVYLKAAAAKEFGEEVTLNEEQAKTLMGSMTRKLRMATALRKRANQLEEEALQLQSIALAGTDTAPYWLMMKELYGTPSSYEADEPLDDEADIFQSLGNRDVPLAELLKVEPGSSSGAPPSKKAAMAAQLPALPTEPPKVSVTVDLHEAEPVIPDKLKDLAHFGIREEDRPQCQPTGKYKCMFCSHQAQNRAGQCTHTRHFHLGICLMCPHCPTRVWGSDGWRDHLEKVHPGKEMFPANPPILLPQAPTEEAAPE